MITASKLERVAACPASEALPHIESTSVYAERGQAIHLFLATARRLGAEVALANVPEEWRATCEAIDLDALPTTLMAEAAYAYDPITGTARFLGSDKARDYSAALPHEMCGTADVVGIDGERGYVADWFTGWGEMRKERQLRFLALCVSLVYGVDEVVIEAIRVREDGSAWRETKTLDVLDFSAIAAETRILPSLVEVAKATIAAGATPTVTEGPHCKHCPASAYCPARVRLLAIAAAGGDEASPFLMGGLVREMVGPAWILAERLLSMGADLRRRVHGAMDEFGEVPTSRGTVLRKVLTPGNEKIDGNAAVSILRDLAGAQAVEECAEVTITKTSLGAGLRKLHGRDGAAKTREVLDELRRRGAVKRTASERLVELNLEEKAS